MQQIVDSMPRAVIKEASCELWRYRLDKPIGGSGVSQIDIVVVELSTETQSGMGFSYVLGGGGEIVFALAQQMLTTHVEGQPLTHPASLWRKIVQTFNRLGRGPNNVALAAIDLAAWDLFARSQGLPLGVALGGTDGVAVPIYGSGEFYAGQQPDEAAEAALRHLARGIPLSSRASTALRRIAIYCVRSRMHCPQAFDFLSTRTKSAIL